MLTSYSASTYFLLQCPQECCKLREHTGPWMLPMPRDFSRQALSPSPVQPSDFVLSVAKAASLPSAILTLTFDPGRSIIGSDRVKSFLLLSPEVPLQWRSVHCPAQTGTTPGATEGRVQKVQMAPCLFMDVCSTHPCSSPIFLPAFLDRGGTSISPYPHCVWWRWWGSLTPDYYGL